jgi:hypothetical protein
MMKYFGEDESKHKLEEFFSIWNIFLQSFNEIKTEIKIKKQRELDDKKHREEGSNGKYKSRQSIVSMPKNETEENNSNLYFKKKFM